MSIGVRTSSLDVDARELAARHTLSDQAPARLASLAHIERLTSWIARARSALTHAESAEGADAKAAEWLLDNEYLVVRAIRQIARDMPPGFYARLPVLSGGGMRPARIHAVAHALLESSRLQLSLPTVTRFVEAYQTRATLTIGELWALPTFLRLGCLEVLVEALVELRPALEPPCPCDAPRAAGLDHTERIGRAISNLRTIASIPWKDFFCLYEPAGSGPWRGSGRRVPADGLRDPRPLSKDSRRPRATQRPFGARRGRPPAAGGPGVRTGVAEARPCRVLAHWRRARHVRALTRMPHRPRHRPAPADPARGGTCLCGGARRRDDGRARRAGALCRLGRRGYAPRGGRHGRDVTAGVDAGHHVRPLAGRLVAVAPHPAEARLRDGHSGRESHGGRDPDARHEPGQRAPPARAPRNALCVQSGTGHPVRVAQ